MFALSTPVFAQPLPRQIMGETTGLNAASVVLDFNSLGFGPAEQVSLLALPAVGIGFQNAFFGPASYYHFPFPSSALYNYDPFEAEPTPPAPIHITFDRVVTGVAFNLFAFPGKVRFEAYLNSELKDYFELGMGCDYLDIPCHLAQMGKFSGFENLDFNEIRVQSLHTEWWGQALGIDNLQIAIKPTINTTVPEPSTVVLLSAGLLALAHLRRRTRR